MPTGLLLIAHGSPDPRHAATMRTVADDVRGDVEAHVTLGYLEHNAPTATAALDELLLDNRRVVAVSLLLADGYDAEADVPPVLAHAPSHRPVEYAGALGLGPWLIPVLERRAADLAQDGPVGPVVLCAADSSHPEVRESVGSLAGQWSALHGRKVRVAFATGPGPLLADVLAEESASRLRCAVVPLLLAEGRMHDQVALVAAEHGVQVAPVIAPSAELTDRIVTLARGQVVLPNVGITA